MDILTMKAVVIFKSGGPEVVRVEEVDRPSPVKGEVLIRVHAAGINPADFRGRSGFADLPPEYRPNLQRPSIPGSDVSGVVVSMGPETTGFTIGDEVYGLIKFPPVPGRSGRTHAEYVAVPVEDIALKPKNMTHVEAAASPMTALTAWQQIFGLGIVQPGQTILINGAAGGVGHFAVQLAKLKGAHVIAVASGSHKQFLRELGADDFIDYTKNEPSDIVHKVDAVMDCIGGPESKRFLKIIKLGGIITPINLSMYPPEELAERAITVKIEQARSSGTNLRTLTSLFENGSLKVAIDSIFPLAEARKAHEHGERGHLRGKIVLEMGIIKQ